jgi:hypothetical protein
LSKLNYQKSISPKHLPGRQAGPIGNLKDTDLANFFNRIAYRKGRPAAISATARKLAVIIWNMIVKAVPYKPENN